MRDNYSRSVIGEIVLRNSRADHVLKLLNSTRQRGSILEVEEPKKGKTLHRMKRIEIFYASKF
jgi:uncharacterized protein YdeI (YjbR/CyaY-like superfamily)